MERQTSGIIVLGAALVAGSGLQTCRNERPPVEPTPSSAGASSAVPGATATDTALPAVAGDLSAQEVAEFYHYPEGSEVLPYFVLRSKLLRTGDQPFWEHLERFGLLGDADSERNPEGLPVGMTLDVPRDMSFLGLRMTGFNCAACHVGEISAEGKTLRVLGAPSRFDIKSFYREFGAALRAPLESVSQSWQLFRESLKERNAARALRGAAPAGAQARAAGEAADRSALSSLEQFDPEHPATPFEEELARALQHQYDQARRESAPQRRPSLLDGATRLGETRRQVRPGLVRALQRPEAELPQGIRELVPAAREQAVTELVTEFTAVIQLLVSRLRLATQIGKVEDSVAPGPGRVDAFVTAKDILFGTTDPPNSPVSFPHLWSIDATHWLHWDGNTNSVMERNLGQAIGLGAVFDAQHKSTLLPRNIHALESWARRLRAPSWPFALDAQKVARGRALFEDKCASCHGPSPGSENTALAEIETDPNRAESFASQVNGQPLAQELHILLEKIKNQAYADAQPPISAEQAKEFEAGRLPSIWRGSRAYANRTLSGVWATAPYLHNGSVPTLAQLLELQPRPSTFQLGQRGYDTQLVGVPTQGSGSFTFDTRTPGNHNTGHSGSRYGSTLPEPDRWALLEYLKTL